VVAAAAGADNTDGDLTETELVGESDVGCFAA
jgi:hypothetical protein